MIASIGEKVDDNTYFDTAHWPSISDNNVVRF